MKTKTKQQKDKIITKQLLWRSLMVLDHGTSEDRLSLLKDLESHFSGTTNVTLSASHKDI